MNNSNRSFKSWRLKQRPSGEIESTDLELVDDIIPEINDNEILVKTIYFSVMQSIFSGRMSWQTELSWKKIKSLKTKK